MTTYIWIFWDEIGLDLIPDKHYFDDRSRNDSVKSVGIV